MGYYLTQKDFTPKREYKRISEYNDGLLVMKQNGFVYLIIRDNEKQWEFAVCLSTGQLKRREDIESGYDKHQLGFIRVNGIVELRQTNRTADSIEAIIQDHVSEETSNEIMQAILDAEIIE